MLECVLTARARFFSGGINPKPKQDIPSTNTGGDSHTYIAGLRQHLGCETLMMVRFRFRLAFLGCSIYLCRQNISLYLFYFNLAQGQILLLVKNMTATFDNYIIFAQYNNKESLNH